jgi:hypothetical protein
MAVEKIVDELKARSKKVTTPEEIAQVSDTNRYYNVTRQYIIKVRVVAVFMPMVFVVCTGGYHQRQR